MCSPTEFYIMIVK